MNKRREILEVLGTGIGIITLGTTQVGASDSARVRIINLVAGNSSLSPVQTLSAVIDGDIETDQLPLGSTSDPYYLSTGEHSITINNIDGKEPYTQTVDIDSGDQIIALTEPDDSISEIELETFNLSKLKPDESSIVFINLSPDQVSVELGETDSRPTRDLVHSDTWVPHRVTDLPSTVLVKDRTRTFEFTPDLSSDTSNTNAVFLVGSPTDSGVPFGLATVN